MAYRIALHTLEWLAVAAATIATGLWLLGAPAACLLAIGVALICASLLRGIAFRRAADQRADALLRALTANPPGRPVNYNGRRS